MRLRNIKNALEILMSNPNIIAKPEDYKTQWFRVFENNNPIYIEIGMGKGDFIISMALKYPNINFIGIEKQASVLVRAAQKIESKIPNLKLINADASTLNNIFDQEINAIYLNHSDPWPKAKHAKRRLTSPTFLNLYQQISIDNLILYMRTDNKNLFEYSIEQFVENGFIIKNINHNLPETTDVITEYEKKFRKLGYPIYYLEAFYGKK